MVANGRAQKPPVDVSATGALAAETGRAVNVRDFGAKGDGKADDTAAVRAAAQAATGGTLTFVAGSTYKLTGAVSIGARTRVVGTGAVIHMALAPDDSAGRLFVV